MCISKTVECRKRIHFPAERRLTLIQAYNFKAFISSTLEVDLLLS